MGVEDANAIDLITRSKDGAIILIMIEERAWDGSGEQLLELQAKINAYLSFALDGQLAEQYPEAEGRPIIIQLDTIHAPDESVLGFLQKAEPVLRHNGVGFRLNLLKDALYR